MAISFASAPGNLFNRLGKLGLLLSEMRDYQLAQLTNMTNTTTGVVAQFDAESDLQAIMGSSYIGALTAPESVGNTAQQLAVATVNRVVFRDNPRIFQNLQSQNTIASIQEIIRQMGVAGATVFAAVVTATPGTFVGFGNGVVVASVRRPLDGRILENAYAESIQVLCTSDSYDGGATEGNETFTVTGAGSQNDFFAFDWPLGSNCQASINAIDGNVSNGSGNNLTNSGFDEWTGNIPDNFTLDVGTAGVNINQENTIVYDGSNSALRITGDGSGTLTELRQVFNDAAGTSFDPAPLTQYSLNLFMRRDGTIPAAGTLVIDLVDENDTTILDEGGNFNSFSIDLTALTTVYTPYNFAFRTPLVLPETMYLRIRLTVALTNGRSVYADRMSLGNMTQLYTGGPFLACHSGGVPFQSGDYAFVPVTNVRGGAGDLDTFQTLLARFFPDVILANELMLPSSNVPSISDSLIG